MTFSLKFIHSVNKFMVYVWRACPSSAEMQYIKSINQLDFSRKLPENRVTKNDVGRIFTFLA